MKAKEFLTAFHARCEANNVNDLTVDQNANRGDTKTVKGIMRDCTKSLEIEFNKLFLSDYIEKVERFLPPEHYWGLVEDGELYYHDISHPEVYCYAINTGRLVDESTKFGRLTSSPMKRIDSYISAVCDIVDQFAFHIAGAIGLGTVIIDMARILLEREGVIVEHIIGDESLRYRIKNLFQQFVHSVNHESRGDESAFTNISVFDENILEQRFSSYDNPELVTAVIELQKIFLEFFDKGDPHSDGAPYTFPIVTINAVDPSKSKFIDWCCENIDLVRYNFFLSEEPKVASCCTLLSDLELMQDFAPQANSFGAGFADIGSHRVISLNLPRYALKAQDMEEYRILLKWRVRDAVVMLKAHKQSLYDLVQKGVYPAITQGWINLQRLFSTIGLIGTYEAEQILNGKGVKGDITKITLDTISEEIYKLAKQFNLAINLEQVPGETASIKLARKDQEFFGADLQPFSHYSRQFLPLWKDADLFEKFKAEGKYLKDLTGGGITLARLSGKVTDPKVKKSLLCLAYDNHARHVAFTSTFSCCKNGHTSHGKYETCPQCDEPIVDYIEKPCGYNQRVSCWWKDKVQVDWQHRTYLDTQG